MPFKQFKCVNEQETPSSFISSQQEWQHTTLPIKMVICHFTLIHYNIDYYQRFHIRAPNNIVRSVTKRQAEHLAGRVAATTSVQLLYPEMQKVTIGVGKQRAPIWPISVNGSITHSSSTAAAIVGKTNKVQYLGLDIEQIMNEELSNQIANEIHNTHEAEILIQSGLNKNLTTTLIFSCKEALFKALYPCVNKYFGFEEARVSSIDVHNQHLILRLNKEFQTQHKLLSSYKCNFYVSDSHVYTVVY